MNHNLEMRKEKKKKAAHTITTFFSLTPKNPLFQVSQIDTQP